MFGFFRAGGFAAAFSMLAALTAAPSLAAESEAAPLAAATASVVSLPATVPATPAPATPASDAAVTAAPGAAAPATSPAQATPVAQPVPPVFAAPKQRRPLRDLVIAFVDYGNQDGEQECLAKAVYFEARGETLEGRLAVAEVVLNRAASGLYPPTICGVVTQPAQFSFIRGGKFPPVDRTSQAWREAVAVAEIARKQLADAIAPNVLWYHASYVAPSWGRRLTRVARIGTHIFYS
ncbi:MAG: cell wall hydrolase [Pseudomonadota bacterium]|nr:cell wall hydrolase [Pseudomonadota bacterium]